MPTQFLHNSSLFSCHLELRREADLQSALTTFLPCFIVLIVHRRGVQSACLHFWQPKTPNVHNSYLQAARGIPGWATCFLLPLIYCLLHLRIGAHHPSTSHKWNSPGVGMGGAQGIKWNVVKTRGRVGREVTVIFMFSSTCVPSVCLCSSCVPCL